MNGCMDFRKQKYITAMWKFRGRCDVETNDAQIVQQIHWEASANVGHIETLANEYDHYNESKVCLQLGNNTISTQAVPRFFRTQSTIFFLDCFWSLLRGIKKDLTYLEIYVEK